MQLLYTLIGYAVLPWALLHLVLRGRRQPGYLQHVGERFGFYSFSLPGPVIWIHAVSVGETRAAEPLIRALLEREPDAQILLTHMTPTGRETALPLLGDRVKNCYLPYDLPGPVRRFLGRFRPVRGIVMETEVWPNLVAACVRRDVPVHLVNARMSEKSARGYARFRAITAPAFRRLAGVGAQTERDAQRLRELGAGNVKLTGNIKFDRAAPPEQIALGKALRAQFGESRKVFLAASTRDGEEALVLDATAGTDDAGLLTVIVPRHPQRFDQVAALLEQRRIPFQLRSENRPVGAEVRAVLGDSMGELFAYYAAADVAFVGGSLLPLGGQNLLEACAVGCPVIVGPHTFNFAEATELAIEAGAAIRVADARELAQVVARLLDNPEQRSAMGEAGRRFTESHRGATERTLALLGIGN
ncbi:MAG: lipid IV(A) 3-deoxy-D-manno-octulosonic acid transferase [Burkholderiales bacterium]